MNIIGKMIKKKASMCNEIAAKITTMSKTTILFHMQITSFIYLFIYVLIKKQVFTVVLQKKIIVKIQ